VEIIATGGFESGSNVSSGGTFEAIGNASVAPHVLSGAVFEVGSGAVTSVANEIGVTVKVLSGGLVSGGVALFHNVVTALSGGVVSSLTVSSGGGLIISSGGLASGSTLLSGGTEIVASGGTHVGVTSIASGALLETASGGTAILTGSVANSGTLFASGAQSLIDIAGGATVTGGGIAKIANGIFEIEQPGDNQNVVFQSGGTGGFAIGVLGSAYTGVVSGFGQNVHQFIDFTAIGAVSATLSYTSTSSNSGVLTVTSGGTTSASIHLSGHYTQASFKIGAGIGGSVEITDPPVIAQQSAFGLPGTLGDIEKNGEAAAGDKLTGRMALFRNYIASEFTTAVAGHGGTLSIASPQTEQQTLLAHPHAR
jgi:autotransporter passenger strand-loop-strand repeat protein